MSTFYEELAEILEIEPDQVTSDLRLEDTSWDSLAVVSRRLVRMH
jgi:acyl carrier protein